MNTFVAFGLDQMGAAIQLQRTATWRDLNRYFVPPNGEPDWIHSPAGERMPVVEGIIVGFHDGQEYHAANFADRELAATPDCCSQDSIEGVGVPGGDCASCSLAGFGTGKNGGQACHPHRMLYLLRPGNLLPELVVVARMSVQAHRKYNMALVGKGSPFYTVVTACSLRKRVSQAGNSYSEVAFTEGRKLSPDELVGLRRYVRNLIQLDLRVPPIVATQMARIGGVELEPIEVRQKSTVSSES